MAPGCNAEAWRAAWRSVRRRRWSPPAMRSLAAANQQRRPGFGAAFSEARLDENRRNDAGCGRGAAVQLGGGQGGRACRAGIRLLPRFTKTTKLVRMAGHSRPGVSKRLEFPHMFVHSPARICGMAVYQDLALMSRTVKALLQHESTSNETSFARKREMAPLLEAANCFEELSRHFEAQETELVLAQARADKAEVQLKKLKSCEVVDASGWHCASCEQALT